MFIGVACIGDLLLRCVIYLLVVIPVFLCGVHLLGIACWGRDFWLLRLMINCLCLWFMLYVLLWVCLVCCVDVDFEFVLVV